MAAGPRGEDLLLERQGEFALAHEVLTQAAGGQGGVFLVEGPAGIGKTRFTEAVTGAAEAMGFAVHWARGDDLETGFAFGVVRQLLSSLLVGVTSDERAELLAGAAVHAAELIDVGPGGDPDGPRGDVLAIDFGFARLLEDLADQRPRLVCVDDAHWADLRSLYALRFAIRRLDALPVVMLLAYRHPDDPEVDDLLARVRQAPGTRRASLSALGHEAVSTLVTMTLGGQADDTFRRRLCQVTGGNPFLVREMLEELATCPPDPTRVSAADLDQVVPERIGRFVLGRIRTLGAAARALADAVAILGEGPLDWARRLAHLEEATGVQAADALIARDVLSPPPRLRFRHPVLRQAVRANIPPARRGLAHAEAARLLAEVGAPPEQVVAHVTNALPRADPWAVTTLLAAARRERRRGSPETAVTLLARAEAEPPPPEQRFEIALALARAQVQTRHPDSVDSARRALALANSPSQKTSARLQLVRTLGLTGHFQAALDLLAGTTAADAALDPDLALQVEAELLGVARLHGDTRSEALVRLQELAPRATPPRPESVVLLANLALAALEDNRSPSTVAELAKGALSQGWLAEADSFQLVYAVTSLIWIDHLQEADTACDAALETASRTGSVSLSFLGHALRSQVNLRRGFVADAEADARLVYELSASEQPSERTPFARAHLANALVERDELDEVERVLANPHPREQAGTNPYYLDARARYCLARGHAEAALNNINACAQALTERGGVDTPAMFAWRSQAARAHAQLGDHARARELAQTELVLATTGQVPAAIADSLITWGLVQGGQEGCHELQRALELTEASPRVLTRIRALITLGVLQRRCRDPRSARGHLRQALDLAHHHGATALERRARQELIVAGGRPRRAASTGLDALTPSERRVAQLVSHGLTNRRIADALFISPRTVATHLTHIYQKLGADGRSQLQAFLATRLPTEQDVPDADF